MYLSVNISIDHFWDSADSKFFSLPQFYLLYLFAIKMPITSAVFWIALFEAALRTSVAKFLASSRGF